VLRIFNCFFQKMFFFLAYGSHVSPECTPGPRKTMWRRVLVSALVLASACNAFSFAPASSFTTAAASRRASVKMPQSRSAPVTGLRSLKAMAGGSLPPVLGLAFKGLGKRLVVVTGTTSGLGLTTVKALLKRGDSFVVCAVRDTDKMKDIIKRDGLDSNSCAVLQLDLASFQSVKDFVFNLKVPPLNLSIFTLHLVCN